MARKKQQSLRNPYFSDTRILMPIQGKPIFFHFIDSKNYIVVQMNPQIVKGPFSNLQEAKNELRRIARNGKWKKRMMVEVINGVIKEDPHKINGIDQMPQNGFEKNWGGWNDIRAMIKIAKLFVKNKGEIRGKLDMVMDH